MHKAYKDYIVRLLEWRIEYLQEIMVCAPSEEMDEILYIEDILEQLKGCSSATKDLMQHALVYLKFDYLNNSNVQNGHYYSCTDLTKSLITSKIVKARKSEKYFRKEVK